MRCHALFLLLAAAARTATTTEGFEFDPTRRPFAQTFWNPDSGRIEEHWSIEEVPQFVVVTVDNAIGYQDANYIHNLTKVRQEHVNGCNPLLEWNDGKLAIKVDDIDDGVISPSDTVLTGELDNSHIPITFFMSIFGRGQNPNPLTDCDLVHAYYRAGHEIGTHTLRDTHNPDVSEILNAIRYLTDECKVPIEHIKGFRAPAPSTQEVPKLTDALLGRIAAVTEIEYDASLEGFEKFDEDGRNHIWPFTLDKGMPGTYDDFNGEEGRAYPGLWEVPMYPLIIPDTPFKSIYDPSIGRPAQIFAHNLNQRMDGNRAPLGIYLSSGWLAANSAEFIEWIESTVRMYPNKVYFVTQSQLLDYMKNPIKLENYRPNFRCREKDDDKVTPQNLFPVFPGCMPPLPSGCIRGTFDHDACKCRCDGVFCRDIFAEIAFGSCNVLCEELPGGGEKGEGGEEWVDPDAESLERVDGGWGEWKSWSVCFNRKQTRIRACDNPEPSGVGLDCPGPSQSERGCQMSGGYALGWMSNIAAMLVTSSTIMMMFFVN